MSGAVYRWQARRAVSLRAAPACPAARGSPAGRGGHTNVSHGQASSQGGDTGLRPCVGSPRSPGERTTVKSTGPRRRWYTASTPLLPACYNRHFPGISIANPARRETADMMNRKTKRISNTAGRHAQFLGKYYFFYFPFDSLAAGVCCIATALPSLPDDGPPPAENPESQEKRRRIWSKAARVGSSP